MTADMEAVERMLRGTANAQNEAREIPVDAENGGGGFPGGMKPPVPGSPEEKAMLEAAWADPEFRKAFYAQYGDKLEAMGYRTDGTFPQGGPSLPIGEDGKRGLTIVPEAGFVVKSRTIETNEKVFINFCKSPKVRSFSREPDPNDPTVERVRIPLSLGPARNDLDKGGDPCVVYDVVFNTEVMDQALHSKEFKEFLVGLGMGWVMEKGGGGLDVKNWTTVKLRGNYKGKFPAMQVVRADALIEEVEPEEGGHVGDHHAWEHAALNPPSLRKSAARAAAENSNYADSFGAAQLQREAVPSYKQQQQGGEEEGGGVVVTPVSKVYVELEGGRHVRWTEGWEAEAGQAGEEGVRAVIVKVDMPRAQQAAEADVLIIDSLLSLEVPGKYELDLDLPYLVDENASDAVFDKQKRELTLTLPLKTWTERAYAEARRKVAEQYGTVETEGGKEEGGGRREEVKSRFEEVDDDDDEEEGGGGGKREGEKKAEKAVGSRQEKEGGAEKKEGGLGKKEGGGEKKEGGGADSKSEFEATLKAKLKEKSEKEQEKERAEEGGRKYILGSKEEREAKQLLANGPQVSNRRAFECAQCQWRATATAIRRCRRCQWCEPGSKEEDEMIRQVKEQHKWQASRGADDVGAVDETGGIEDEASIRAFRFSSRLAWELDDDVPDWLKGVREKMYGGDNGKEGSKEVEIDIPRE